MGEGQFTDAMAQQTALWHVAFRDEAVVSPTLPIASPRLHGTPMAG